MPVIGFLGAPSPGPHAHYIGAVQQGLREAGYVERQTLRFEYRWAERHYDHLPALAAELVDRRVAVIVPIGGAPATVAAKAATSTVPIIFNIGADPVNLGPVASLNRPGGNVTGIAVHCDAGWRARPEIRARRPSIFHEEARSRLRPAGVVMSV
jgi:ABC transporter substrate binding protein